jgi:hypothetical protein
MKPSGPVNRRNFIRQTLVSGAALSLSGALHAPVQGAEPQTGTISSTAFDSARRPVAREHPRLFGTREELRNLARQRQPEYQRMAAVARDNSADDYSWILSASLVAAIEGDADLGQRVKQRAMKLVNGPIRVGHEPFGTDLALCGVAFDHCPDAWSEEERKKLCDYVSKTVDANVQSETHVFHNAWYGYKNWGIGVVSYALYHEHDRASAFLRTLEQDYLKRAAPALRLAGSGGGWAEGYYVNYWLYEWLLFCEVARRCESLDYYAPALGFYKFRAIASMFETYPGLSEYQSRRYIPMGDGGGRVFGGDRDKALSARRMLVNRFREDAQHQAVHTFNEQTPRSSVGSYAYKDFLWHDTTVSSGDLQQFPLAWWSRGAGYVYSRSSWTDEATYFFLKCGDRFTAHQHLDVGHFLIWKHTELAGDGGHYDDFGSPHDVNYHLRSIAHSTILVQDPEERWPAIRGGQVTANDGGQHHDWRHHNGALADPADWEKQKTQCDIADILAFEDRGSFLYIAGDATRAYASKKLKLFTRQILFLRPDTFVVFDRVSSTQPQFQKTWLLQAMRPPEQSGDHWVVTNGKGRLFVQSLLPAKPQVRLISGESLYQIAGRNYPPRRDTGPAPQCRIEVSPATLANDDYFLHVLTAADSGTASVPLATAQVQQEAVRVKIGPFDLRFQLNALACDVSVNGQRNQF